MSETIEDLVLRLARERGAGRTICPTEAAKAAAEQRGTPDDWRGKLNAVKAAATRVALRGGVAIYRKGKPVDPNDFKGIYRIGLPPTAEADEAPESTAAPEPPPGALGD
jgi:hypothetical protein